MKPDTGIKMLCRISVHLYFHVSVCTYARACACGRREGKHPFKSTWAIQEIILFTAFGKYAKMDWRNKFGLYLQASNNYLFLKMSVHNKHEYSSTAM